MSPRISPYCPPSPPPSLSPGNDTWTSVILTGTLSLLPPCDSSSSGGCGAASPAAAAAAVTRLDLFIDKSCSGGATRLGVQGGAVDLPPEGLPVWPPWSPSSSSSSRLGLHVFVDGSVVEAFAQGGHGRVTSRIYPLGLDTAWGLRAAGGWGRRTGTVANFDAAEARVAAELTVHELDSCWRDEV